MKAIKFFIAPAFVSIMLLGSCNKRPDACFDASTTTATVGQSINFTSCANNAEKILWDFGDGTKAEGNSATHSYDRGGVFQVEMKVYSRKDKRWDRATRLVNVGPGKTRLLARLEVNGFNINKPDGSSWDAVINTEPDIFLQYGVQNSAFNFSTSVFNDVKLNMLPLVWDFGPEPNKIILTDANWFFQVRDSDLTGSELMHEFIINPLTTAPTSPGKIMLTFQNYQITIGFIEI